MPGRSSSGAGVSLAQGSALAAFGTDTAGSVRVPAAMTGHAGLKTTKGRWSTDGIVPLSPSLDTAGILARSVADLAFLFAAVDGRPQIRAATSPPRIGVIGNVVWDDIDPTIAETTQRALAQLDAAQGIHQTFEVAGSCGQSPEISN